MGEKIRKGEAEPRKILTPQQYHVTKPTIGLAPKISAD
jgi:hypothetical protein